MCSCLLDQQNLPVTFLKTTVLPSVIGQFMFQYCVTCSGNFRFVVRSIFAHAQISITTETLQPPWLTETQGDGWVSGTLGRDMAANPLQALIYALTTYVYKRA